MIKSILFMSIFALTCNAFAYGAHITPTTNLGDAGNEDVLNRYYKYTQGGARCSAATAEGKKILMTGFGLFVGVRSNISSAMINSAMDANILPAQIQRSKFPELNTVLKRGIVQSELGVESAQRKLIIDDQTYTVCFLSLDVQWDFAAAVIVYEMQKFQPDNVFMFGQGANSFIIESGAQNFSMMSSGFTNQGDVLDINTPIEDVMYNGLPESTTLSVDQAKVATMVKDTISALGYDLQLPTAYRPSNDYICNNVAFTAQMAANQEMIPLAGSKIIIEPRFKKTPIVSFIHLPVNAGDSIPSTLWMRFVTDVIASTSK